jgi:hypothetical protein
MRKFVSARYRCGPVSIPPPVSRNATFLPSRIVFISLKINWLSGCFMRKSRRAIRLLKCKRKRIYGDSHTLVVEMRMAGRKRGSFPSNCGSYGVRAIQKNIQICVRVYEKQYGNQLTYFCIVFK